MLKDLHQENEDDYDTSHNCNTSSKLLFKTAKIIIIPKQGKDPNNVTFYSSINLLPITSKRLLRQCRIGHRKLDNPHLSIKFKKAAIYYA